MSGIGRRETLPMPRKRPFFVSFSGIDGAGKTTQIDALLIYLRDAGLRVRVRRFWDDIAVAGAARETLSHKLFKSEKGVGSPEQPVQRRDKNIRGWYMTVARLLLYLLDAARLTFLVLTASQKDADLVIFDRYLYDELVNLDLQKPMTRAYARMLLRFVPDPDVAFLLDADPAKARARKPEYPVEFLQSVRASYLTLGTFSRMKVIGPFPLQDVTRIILRAMPRISMLRALDARPQSLARRQSHQ
jgi:thymidylate kinase